MSTLADHIWDILVDEVGASEDERLRFVQAFPDFPRFREYRFVGSLGFGGKVWTRANGYDVTCYPEDETPDRRRAIERANERLAELWPRTKDA